MTMKPVLLLLLVCAALLGAWRLQAHLLGQGDARGAARVQSAWNDQERIRTAAANQALLTRFRNAERVTYEDTEREATRLARDAAAATAVRSLRSEVARLNQRPGTGGSDQPGAAACVGEATTARELLAESAGAYSELAAQADELRDQVIGLQDFTHNVCEATNHGL